MLVDLIIYLALGALTGWLAGTIMKFKASLLSMIIIGVVGGALGGFLLGGLFSGLGLLGSIITSVLGAIVVIWLAKLIMKK